MEEHDYINQLSPKEAFIQREMGKNLSLDLDENKAMRKRLEELWEKSELKAINAKKITKVEVKESQVDQYELLDIADKLSSYQERMNELVHEEDYEHAHIEADGMLTDMLEFLATKLGFGEEMSSILNAYEDVDKYYS